MEDLRKELDEKIRILKEEFEKKIEEINKSEKYTTKDNFLTVEQKNERLKGYHLSNKISLSEKDGAIFQIFFTVNNYDTVIIGKNKYQAYKDRFGKSGTLNYFVFTFPMDKYNYSKLFEKDFDKYISIFDFLKRLNGVQINIFDLKNQYLYDSYTLDEFDMDKYVIQLDDSTMNILRKYRELLF